jgi:CO/xanthine dehydrogenase Mo-binding subunit
LRTSALRGLGAYANVFAIESFMDELAQAAGIDPVAFRLAHLTDERAKAVIQAAAERAGWQPGTRPSGSGLGQGIAFAQYKNSQCYAAVIVTVEVDLENGRIQLKEAIITADAGQIVNPDGLSNQLEGGFFQAACDKDGLAKPTRPAISGQWRSQPGANPSRDCQCYL